MTVNKEPEISVGIVSGSGLTFTLNGDFIAADTGRRYTGIYTALAEVTVLQSGTKQVLSGQVMRLPFHLHPLTQAASLFTP